MVNYFVLGSTGFFGSALVPALAATKSGNIKAGVRNPDSPKAAPFKTLDNTTVVSADASKPEDLVAVLKGTDVLYVVVPGHIDREKLGKSAIDAAKKASVKHIVMLSVSNAEVGDQTFGKQFAPVEKAVKECGIPYTITRLPLFLENVLGQVGNIKTQGAYYNSAESDKKMNAASLSDMAEAAANIMKSPSDHVGKTYDFGGPLVSESELAAALAKAIGKPVNHVSVPHEAAQKAMEDMGMPQWQAIGVVELLKNINAGPGNANSTYSGDLEKVLGRAPLTAEAWAQNVKGAFA